MSFARATTYAHGRQLGKDVAGVDSFLLEPVAGAFDEERVAVFTTITPLPMKMADGLLGAKRAEMRNR